MNSFLVLGQIPGTNFQISFQMWMNIAGVIIALIVAYRLGIRPHRMKALKTLYEHVSRSPLHASQLHQRAR